MWLLSQTPIFTYLWLFALIRLGCGQDIIFDDYQETGGHTSTPRLPSVPHVHPQRAAASLMKQSCSAPPQPKNGGWRLHSSFCQKSSIDCKVPEGAEFGLGYQLIYDCKTGYKIEGNHTVFCRAAGEWSSIPSCREIQCDRLSDISRSANCFRFGQPVDCDQPLLPRTTAEVSCRSGYTDGRKIPMQLGSIVTCKENGNWQPPPISCVPVCGRVVPYTPPVTASRDSWDASVADFPWHATLYWEKRLPEGTVKMFICGATIIQTNFVMTAAHCVYNEVTRATEDAGRLFIMTGNKYRDYDHPENQDFRISKSAVKKINLPFDYYGIRGNYGSDIALLELLEPFSFHGFTAPACLDVFSPDAPFLQKGIIGRVAGFGRTNTQDSSPNLLTLTAPFVPYNECKAPDDTAENYVFITNDNFCAGYTNGTVVCDGDSGGGLVFEKNNQWYVMGIVSVGLGVDLNNGERTCARHALSLYTKVSEYMNWIEEVISNPKQRISAGPISNVGWSSSVTRPATTQCPICVSPEQPANGEWQLHPTQCTDLSGSVNCRVAPGVGLEAGTGLIYSCDAGYKASGNTEVYCTRLGSWSSVPECITSGPLTNYLAPVVPDMPQEKVGELKWQVSIYEERNLPDGTKKEFLCYATIIKDDLLVTANYCVWNQRINSPLDPKKLYVMLGNIYSDYDSPLHDPNVVEKRVVKDFYMNCVTTGIVGRMHSGRSTMLQLEKPFQFTGIGLPPSEQVESKRRLYPELEALDYILIFSPKAGGKSDDDVQIKKERFDAFKFMFSRDQLSAILINLRSGCPKVNKNEIWYVLRIDSAEDGRVHIDFDIGEKKCEKYLHSL